MLVLLIIGQVHESLPRFLEWYRLPGDLDRYVSAVNDHGVSLNKRRLRGAKKQHGICHLSWLPHSLHWRYFHRGGDGFSNLRVLHDQRGLNDTRTDAVYPDPVLRVIDGIRARHSYYGRFGRAIGR